MPENIRHIKMRFWYEKEGKRLFQELPFYNQQLKNHTLSVLITKICCMDFIF